jgi:hypothetical protein
MWLILPDGSIPMSSFGTIPVSNLFEKIEA